MLNRVRQLPLLFWLLTMTNQPSSGRDIDGYLVYHLFYADDLRLMNLSSASMQKRLDMCSTYAIEHFLTYNGSKSYSLCFMPKHIELFIYNQIPPQSEENNILHKRTEIKY